MEGSAEYLIKNVARSKIAANTDSSAESSPQNTLIQTLNNELIEFNAFEHSYKIFDTENNKWIIASVSVTKFIEIHFDLSKPNFEMILNRMVSSGKFRSNPNYSYIPYDVDDKEAKDLIKLKWDAKKNISCDYGTAMHLMIETYYQTQQLMYNPLLKRETEEFHRFILNEGAMLDIVGVEIRIFDKVLNLAGSIDALFKNKKTGKYVLVDWKRCGISSFEYRKRANKMGMYNIDDKLNKYSLQCNVYANILKVTYKLDVSDMYLWIYNVNTPEQHYTLHEVPLSNYVSSIMNKLRSSATNKN